MSELSASQGGQTWHDPEISPGLAARIRSLVHYKPGKPQESTSPSEIDHNNPELQNQQPVTQFCIEAKKGRSWLYSVVNTGDDSERTATNLSLEDMASYLMASAQTDARVKNLLYSMTTQVPSACRGDLSYDSRVWSMLMQDPEQSTCIYTRFFPARDRESTTAQLLRPLEDGLYTITATRVGSGNQGIWSFIIHDSNRLPVGNRPTETVKGLGDMLEGTVSDPAKRPAKQMIDKCFQY